MMHRSVATLLGLGVALAATSASAKVAALLPQVRPLVAPELRDRFHDALSRGLPEADTLPSAEVRMRLGNAVEMMDCGFGRECADAAQRVLHVDAMLMSQVDVSGKDYSIKLRLVDRGGQELGQLDEPCDICTVKEAEEAMTRAVTRLVASARPVPPPPPAVTSEPPKPLARVELPPPTNDPVLTLPPDKTDARKRKPFPWRPVAISSLVVGAVGVIIGAPLVAIDGQPTCSKSDPRHSCPEVYNTVGAGATMLTLGLAGLAAGGTLFYFDYRERHKPHPMISVAPLNGGAMLSASGRF